MLSQNSKNMKLLRLDLLVERNLRNIEEAKYEVISGILLSYKASKRSKFT